MLATLTIIALTALAVGRLTRLITTDKITQPLRAWLVRRNGADGWVTYLAHCPWCISIWVAAVITPIIWIVGAIATTLSITGWVGVPLTTLAVAQLAAWVSLWGEK